MAICSSTSFLQVGLVLVLACWASESTSAAISPGEQFLLKQNNNDANEIVLTPEILQEANLGIQQKQAPGIQTLVGNPETKFHPTSPVYFSVSRGNTYATQGTPIPYDTLRVNIGNGMNLASGIFTAPVPGVYFFTFNGLAAFPLSTSPSFEHGLGVHLYKNDRSSIITTSTHEATNTVEQQRNPISLSCTLQLNSGDRVWVEIYELTSGTVLWDSNYHYTDFTGLLLEETISLSL